MNSLSEGKHNTIETGAQYGLGTDTATLSDHLGVWVFPLSESLPLPRALKVVPLTLPHLHTSNCRKRTTIMRGDVAVEVDCRGIMLEAPAGEAAQGGETIQWQHLVS
jgi:hypothetical protein